MTGHAYEHLLKLITDAAEPVSRKENKFVSLLEKINDKRFVLIGEASHGTQDFYQARIEITKQLIIRKQFQAIAIEGDWPAVHKAHLYVQGEGDDEVANALIGFDRFPSWMWRNTAIAEFLQWLRQYNTSLPAAKKIGLYGLDLYSLYSSMQAVIDYLDRVDENAAELARKRYACFDHMKIDPQEYGYLTSIGRKKACVQEALTQFIELQHHAADYIRKNNLNNSEDYFDAMQNARLIKNAEHYYRTLFEGQVHSWNIRDEHMTETFNMLSDHLQTRFEQPSKIVVWAHNSHVGDARATEMGEKGEINLGQLIREQHEGTYIIGFSTYTGTVTAASDWDEPAETKIINPGLAGSYEDLFHQIPHRNFILHLQGSAELEHYLHIPRLQRAIGVVYRPDTERDSHYFFTHLPYQFDSLIHFDHTTAVQPIS